MTDFPIQDVFAPLGWIFVVLLAANVVLYAFLIGLHEKWWVYRHRREHIRERLAPIVERLVSGADAEQASDELRPVVASLSRAERPVGAWLLKDMTRDADEQTLHRVSQILDESGATELAERSTRRRTAWRRALACEILGAIGAERSVPVLVERLDDGRGEVRMAAARALGTMGSPLAAPALTSAFLERSKVPTGVAYDALRGLGRHGAAAFHEGLRSRDPTVRVASCFGIAALTGSNDGDVLTGVLEDDNNIRVRAAAVKALGVIGGTTPPRVLLDAVDDPEIRVRREAVAALGVFDDPGAVDTLAVTADDPDREIALRSAESLIALRDRPRAGAAAAAALTSSTAWSVDYARTISELTA